MTTTKKRVHATREVTREALRLAGNCVFVDAYEFRRLVVSNRRLVRADAPEAGLRGLMDEVSGERFLTEEERLFTA